MDLIGKEAFCKFVEKILGESPLNVLSPEAIGILDSIVRVVKLSKGEYLQLEGNVSKHWGIVAEGLVRIYYMEGEEEITEQLIRENEDFMDYDSFLDQTPSRRFIQMIEPTTLFLISRLECEEASANNLELRRLFRRMMECKLLYVKRKTQQSIFKSAKERYDDLIARKPDLILRVPSVYIASFLGVTPETLSRIRSNVK